MRELVHVFRIWRARRSVLRDLRRRGYPEREIRWRVAVAQIRVTLRDQFGIETRHHSDWELAQRIAAFVEDVHSDQFTPPDGCYDPYGLERTEVR